MSESLLGHFHQNYGHLQVTCAELTAPICNNPSFSPTWARTGTCLYPIAQSPKLIAILFFFFWKKEIIEWLSVDSQIKHFEMTFGYSKFIMLCKGYIHLASKLLHAQKWKILSSLLQDPGNCQSEFHPCGFPILDVLYMESQHVTFVPGCFDLT